MKVLFLDSELILKVIPRIFPSLVDTLTLNLVNENSGVVITPDITFEITDKLEITIINEPTDFKTQNKYSIELKNGSEIIYLGKLITLENGTNVQNYEYGSQTNARFKFKE
jgi:hypothetical protein